MDSISTLSMNYIDLLQKRGLVLSDRFFGDFDEFYNNYAFLGKKKVDLLFNNYLKENAFVEKTFIADLKNYFNGVIENEIKGTNSCHTVQNLISKYNIKRDSLFDTIDFVLNFLNIDLNKNDLNYLIDNSEEIKGLLKYIFKDKKFISSERFEDYSLTYFGSLIMELYVSLNDIVIKEDSVYIDKNNERIPLLTLEEEQVLFKRFGDGENVTEEIIRHNVGLVKKIASRYVKKEEDFDDLYQEGMIGLMKAIDRYDYTKGFKFATYATWWIKQAITRYVYTSTRTIRIPVHAEEVLLKIKRYINKYQSFYGESPSYSLLAKEFNLPEKKIEDLLVMSQALPSIDMHVSEDGDTELVDLIVADSSLDSPDAAFMEKSLQDDINSVLDSFKPKEKDIIVSHYGLNGHKKETLEEIGKRYGVTRERIRQIENKVILKISHVSAYRNVLKSHYYNDDDVVGNKRVFRDLLSELGVRNVNLFNAFLANISDDSYKIIKDTFYSNYKVRNQNIMILHDYNLLSNDIEEVRYYRKIVDDELSLRIVYELSAHPKEFSIFDYIDTNDKWMIEYAINNINITLRKYIVNHFDLNTGKPVTKIGYRAKGTIIDAIRSINKYLLINRVPKDIYDQNKVIKKEKLISFFDWIESNEPDKINYLFANMDDDLFNTVRSLFGTNLKIKLSKEVLDKHPKELTKIKTILCVYNNGVNSLDIPTKSKYNIFFINDELRRRDIIDYLYSVDSNTLDFILSHFNLKSGASNILSDEDVIRFKAFCSNMQSYYKDLSNSKIFDGSVIDRYFDGCNDDAVNFVLSHMKAKSLRKLQSLLKENDTVYYKYLADEINSLIKIFDYNSRGKAVNITFRSNLFDTFYDVSKEDIYDYIFTLSKYDLDYLSSFCDLKTGKFKPLTYNQKYRIYTIFDKLKSFTNTSNIIVKDSYSIYDVLSGNAKIVKDVVGMLSPYYRKQLLVLFGLDLSKNISTEELYKNKGLIKTINEYKLIYLMNNSKVENIKYATTNLYAYLKDYPINIVKMFIASLPREDSITIMDSFDIDTGNVKAKQFFSLTKIKMILSGIDEFCVLENLIDGGTILRYVNTLSSGEINYVYEKLKGLDLQLFKGVLSNEFFTRTDAVELYNKIKALVDEYDCKNYPMPKMLDLKVKNDISYNFFEFYFDSINNEAYPTICLKYGIGLNRCFSDEEIVYLMGIKKCDLLNIYEVFNKTFKDSAASKYHINKNNLDSGCHII